MSMQNEMRPIGRRRGVNPVQRRWRQRVIVRATLALFAAAATMTASCHPRPSEAPAPAPHEASVKPGINEPYKTTSTEEWVQRFETESRDIYRERVKIADWVHLRAGQRVADIGAGTGIFEPLFAERVGRRGIVYAVDITPGFIERIEQNARSAGLSQVHAVLCKEDSVELPANSIDVAFICDTYHHFEFPRATMASIARALRPKGQVVVVDFIRVTGVSRDWIFDHVRCGKEQVIQEIESDGFKLIESAQPEFLQENYLLRFEKGATAARS